MDSVTAREAYQEAVKINRFLRAFEHFESILQILEQAEGFKATLDTEVIKRQATIKKLVAELDSLDGKALEKETALAAIIKQGEGILAKAIKDAQVLDQEQKQNTKKFIESQLESFKAKEESYRMTLNVLQQEIVELQKSKQQALSEYNELRDLLVSERQRVANLFKGL